MKNFQFSVADMDCKSCVNIITRKLTSLDGVKKVEIDGKTKKVSVEYDDPGLCETDLMCAVEALGYKVHMP